MSGDHFFTVVFAGNLRRIGKNPFKIKSDFGEPLAVAIGDALKELDEYCDESALTSAIREDSKG